MRRLRGSVQQRRPPLYLTNIMVFAANTPLPGEGSLTRRDLFGTARHTKEGAPQGVQACEAVVLSHFAFRFPSSRVCPVPLVGRCASFHFSEISHHLSVRR